MGIYAANQGDIKEVIHPTKEKHWVIQPISRRDQGSGPTIKSEILIKNNNVVTFKKINSAQTGL